MLRQKRIFNHGKKTGEKYEERKSQIENLVERRRVVTHLRLHVIRIDRKNGVRRDVRGAEEAILQAELWRSFTRVSASVNDQLNAPFIAFNP